VKLARPGREVPVRASRSARQAARPRLNPNPLRPTEGYGNLVEITLAPDNDSMRGLVALAVLVVVGSFVWKHLPGGGVIAVGGGPRPANWNQVNHGTLPPITHPTLGSNHAISSIVAGNYEDSYRRGQTAAPSSVDCPSVSSSSLDTQRASWGATGSFYDCSITLADGTQSTECWFQSGSNYRMAFSIPPAAPGPIQPPIKGSCEFFAQTTSRIDFTEVVP
jgi:hypothetical protein